MSIFQVAIFVIAALQAACVAPRTYTEQEKLALAQTKTLWVEVQSDSRTLPAGIAGIGDKVEHDVKEKLTRAGLTIAPDRSSADAVLQLVLSFSHKTPLEELPSNDDATYRYNAHSMHINASLNHKDVGQVFWHGGSVSPPYDLNLSNSAIIRYIDSDVLEALFKSTLPVTKKE